MIWFGQKARTKTDEQRTGGPSFSEIPKVDVRWKKLKSKDTLCSCCSVPLLDLLSLGYNSPDAWGNRAPNVLNSEFGETIGDALSTDFCRIDNDFFIRAVLPIPLLGSSTPLVLGTWAKVEAEFIKVYLETFESGKQGALDMTFCWIANYISFNPSPIPAIMKPRDNFNRPVLRAALDEHPLAIAQEDGLDFDQLIQVLTNLGHKPLLDE